MEALRVLIVEDEPGLAAILCRTLIVGGGGLYAPESCSCGEAALARLAEQNHALLITDLNMPGMDGLALLQRAREVSPGTRSILITAYGTPEVQAAARMVGDYYLPKPFGLKEFLTIVRQITADSGQH